MESELGRRGWGQQGVGAGGGRPQGVGAGGGGGGSLHGLALKRPGEAHIT